jgi:hypothetical protein
MPTYSILKAAKAATELATFFLPPTIFGSVGSLNKAKDYAIDLVDEFKEAVAERNDVSLKQIEVAIEDIGDEIYLITDLMELEKTIINQIKYGDNKIKEVAVAKPTVRKIRE